MATTPDQPLITYETARQIVDASRDASGFRILWRQDLSAAAPAITSGMPRGSENAGRLIWWPDGVCERRRVSVMSSRLGSHHDQHRWWYDLLRTAVLRVNGSSECLLAVADTTAGRAVTRCAQLFGLPCIAMRANDRSTSPDDLTDWVIRCVHQSLRQSAAALQTDDSLTWRAEVSPIDTGHGLSRLATAAPVRDEMTLRFGERVYVLACRDGGHVDRLLRDALPKQPDDQRLICVADSPGTSRSTFASLRERGAIAWLVAGVAEDAHPAVDETDQSALSKGTSGRQRILSDGPLTHPERWLCHWTRPCEGPWPGQPDVDFLDELILGCETADRSALAALLQIISRQTIIASSTTVSGDCTVVSFTEVPLSEFRQRRVWRRHRRRYDFEPWGIAIRKDVLETAGAKPVVYGTDDDRQRLNASEVIWFQRARDASGRIDWTTEREWRVPGNLDLSSVPANSVCVFVDSADEAAVASADCSWPVIIVPG